MSLMPSWIESANAAAGSFPLNNLPFGVYSQGDGAPACCTAIGDFVLDLARLERVGLIALEGGAIFDRDSLNDFMALGPDVWAQLRQTLIDILAEGADEQDRRVAETALIPLTDVIMHMPFKVAEFTDFFSGRHHAENAGTMFRGRENALQPNWLHIPVGYNGRASTVVVSGTDIVRPQGQLKSPKHETPIFAASRRLDIELEMGAIVGMPSQMGKPVSVDEADAMIFGYVILNDWSARDIQAWEYQPLGPFQAKAFATSISPWVVTRAALEPFRVSTPAREKQLLPYLKENGPMLYDIELQVAMQPASAVQETVISRTNYREMYYSAAQQLAHHSSSGCAMNIGDLLGSGTISGPDEDTLGSLLEISWGGQKTLTLEGGETRTFIEDGDKLTLRGHAQGEGYRIGFGECTATILPAIGSV
ncbi:MAG: fumarylacetoacetase [Rhizobiaceae bacterium]